MVKNLPHNAENVGSIPGTGRLPGRKEWLPISIARRIPWTEEPDSRIQPMGSKESDTSEQLTHTHTHRSGKLRQVREGGHIRVSYHVSPRAILTQSHSFFTGECRY